jgi:uncharacterized protein (TIGR02145 family)
LLLILSIYLLLFSACDHHGTTPQSNDSSNPAEGIMNISLDMTNAPTEVVNLKGILYHDHYDDINIDFEIGDNIAKAFIEYVPSGNWYLTVNAFNADNQIIYTGEARVTIYPGEITPVSIHLNPASGSLEIVVTWGSLCRDIDGNIYKTVRIGNQIWMAENLRVTHYRNGDAIPHVSDNSEWADSRTDAYCNNYNDRISVTTYGRLYNWFAVIDKRNIAPVGWRVATDDDWKELEIYLGMSRSDVDGNGMRGTNEGGKIKEPGTDHWNSPNTGATNETGITALGGGGRSFDGTFFGFGEDEDWWTATEDERSNAWSRGLDFDSAKIDRCSDVKQCGFSIRCVKN